MDRNGAAQTVVIGVGGFLGFGKKEPVSETQRPELSRWGVAMKDQTTRRSLRSAIYTRVSTDQGLEQTRKPLLFVRTGWWSGGDSNRWPSRAQ
jgi:hypothetical protein